MEGGEVISCTPTLQQTNNRANHTPKTKRDEETEEQNQARLSES
jgi:hypothetical protein